MTIYNVGNRSLSRITPEGADTEPARAITPPRMPRIGPALDALSPAKRTNRAITPPKMPRVDPACPPRPEKNPTNKALLHDGPAVRKRLFDPQD